MVGIAVATMVPSIAVMNTEASAATKIQKRFLSLRPGDAAVAAERGCAKTKLFHRFDWFSDVYRGTKRATRRYFACRRPAHEDVRHFIAW
jgi:hypothetical protein